MHFWWVHRSFLTVRDENFDSSLGFTTVFNRKFHRFLVRDILEKTFLLGFVIFKIFGEWPCRLWEQMGQSDCKVLNLTFPIPMSSNCSIDWLPMLPCLRYQFWKLSWFRTWDPIWESKTMSLRIWEVVTVSRDRNTVRACHWPRQSDQKWTRDFQSPPLTRRTSIPPSNSSQKPKWRGSVAETSRLVPFSVFLKPIRATSFPITFDKKLCNRAPFFSS